MKAETWNAREWCNEVAMGQANKFAVLILSFILCSLSFMFCF